MNRLLPLVTLILATGCSSPARERSAAPSAPPRYVDLTHELSSDSIFWPTGETFRLEKVADGITEKGYYYASNRFSGNEHGGTHIDAPVHFAQGRWTVDQIPLDSLIGDAIVVDVSAREQLERRLPGLGRRLYGLGEGAPGHRARNNRPHPH